MSENKLSFHIYQLRHEPSLAYHYFASYVELQRLSLTVHPSNYELVYSGSRDAQTTLEDIFRQFNLAHPEDFHGHSLSVSDIVVFQNGDEQTAYYCDSIGFQEVPEFFAEPDKTASLSERVSAAKQFAEASNETIPLNAPSKENTHERNL